MCKNHFSPVQCIIPPYINDKLADSPDKDIARIAVNTKFRSFRFRSDRVFFKNASQEEKALLGVVAKKRLLQLHN